MGKLIFHFFTVGFAFSEFKYIPRLTIQNIANSIQGGKSNFDMIT